MVWLVSTVERRVLLGKFVNEHHRKPLLPEARHQLRSKTVLLLVRVHYFPHLQRRWIFDLCIRTARRNSR